MALPRRYWQDMTTVEFASLDTDKVIAVLPVGAIEQHGPHLPVYVDACLNRAILNRAAEQMPADLPVTILPDMPVGKSNEHQAFPGTLTLTSETITRLWTDIGESVARAGIRKLVLFNSHGGQPQIMDIVATDLRARHKMFVVSVSWFGLGLPDNLFPSHEVRHGIHGGMIETAMMLHARPDLVRMDKAADFDPVTTAMADEYDILSATGPAAFAWQAQDLHPAGVAGDAAAATAEQGRMVIDHVAARLVRLLQEVERAPLDLLRDYHGGVAGS